MAPAVEEYQALNADGPACKFCHVTLLGFVLKGQHMRLGFFSLVVCFEEKEVETINGILTVIGIFLFRTSL